MVWVGTKATNQIKSSSHWPKNAKVHNMVDIEPVPSGLPIPNVVRGVETHINAGLFKTVEERMSSVPALGRYVIQQMGDAINLSERILIAETALVVYQAMYNPKLDTSHIDDTMMMVIADEGKFPGEEDKSQSGWKNRTCCVQNFKG